MPALPANSEEDTDPRVFAVVAAIEEADPEGLKIALKAVEGAPDEVKADLKAALDAMNDAQTSSPSPHLVPVRYFARSQSFSVFISCTLSDPISKHFEKDLKRADHLGSNSHCSCTFNHTRFERRYNENPFERRYNETHDPKNGDRDDIRSSSIDDDAEKQVQIFLTQDQEQ